MAISKRPIARTNSRSQVKPPSIVLAFLVATAVMLSAGCSASEAAQPNFIAGLTCATGSVSSPGSAACNVHLMRKASQGGVTVQVASSNPGVSVPATVVVPGGSASVNFSANASSGLPAGTASLTATYHQHSKSFLLSIAASSSPPAALSSVLCSTTSLSSPGTGSCNVNLTGAAPSGGVAIQLSSSNSTAMSVPASVLVPAGNTTAGFAVSVAAGLSAQTVILTATGGQTSKSVQLSIIASTPPDSLSSLSCSGSSLSSPGSGSCIVNMSGAAPSGGLSIQMSSSASGVSVPASVSVPSGSTSAAFTVSASSGLPSETITLTATYSQVSKAVQLQVVSAPVVAVSVAPASTSLQTGATQQFTPSVSGTTNTAVSWKVSGAGCTGADCGSIASTGLYTAPAAGPSPASVTVTVTSLQDTTKSASATVGINSAPVTSSSGTTYYLAPNGSDSNNGLSANSPWLTPNHSVNCGDVLLAAAGNYAASSFNNGNWGRVSCPASNNVAWVKCATPFGCILNNSIYISASYWGLQGFRISSSGACLIINPNFNGNRVEVHHIIAANNIVGPCGGDAIASVSGYNTNPTIGADYLAYLGNIAYNSGGNSSSCSAALSFWVPIPYDTNPGTHLYVAGNFSWGNTSSCGDGEGIIFDTFDGHDGTGSRSTQPPYSYQAVAENNMMVFNDGPGIQVDLNQYGTSPHAPIYFMHNTSAYNCLGPSASSVCGEILLSTTVNANADHNLVVAPTRYAFGGSSVTHYGSAVVFASSSTNHISNEFAYSAYGYGVGSVGSTGFVPGPNNITSSDPQLANPVDPGTPSCNGYETTTSCMANVIANFAPSNAAATSYGYQLPNSTAVNNPYYPQWLCGVTDLPSGLVTPGCAP